MLPFFSLAIFKGEFIDSGRVGAVRPTARIPKSSSSMKIKPHVGLRMNKIEMRFFFPFLLSRATALSVFSSSGLLLHFVLFIQFAAVTLSCCSTYVTVSRFIECPKNIFNMINSKQVVMAASSGQRHTCPQKTQKLRSFFTNTTHMILWSQFERKAST